ncbi:MAG: metallophosphoesterase [Pseudomonadota bacterium]
MRGTSKTQRLRADLRILTTSDVHATVFTYDYVANRVARGRGFAQLATAIEQAKANHPNTLVLDNGDFLGGTALADFSVEMFERGKPMSDPVIAAMNAVGYDAVGLGNHELDFGLPYLRKACAEARFPMISSNLDVVESAHPGHVPEVILTREIALKDGTKHKLNIGLLSVLPPQTVAWNDAELKGMASTGEILSAAKAASMSLRAKGADIVIALAHTGLGESQENAGSILLNDTLADAVILGHTHEVHPPIAETLSPKEQNWLMPGFGGRYLGILDLALEISTDPSTPAARTWHCGKARAKVRAIAPETLASPQVLEETHQAHRATRAHLDQVLTRITHPLSAAFGLTHPSNALQCVAEALMHELGPHIDPALTARAPLMAAVSPARYGGFDGHQNFLHIPSGNLRERDLVGLYPFRNTVELVELSSADLRIWIGHSSQIYRQITPDPTPNARPQELLEASAIPYFCDTIFGLTYRIDLAEPPGPARVKDLAQSGEVLRPDQRVLVLTHSYRLSLLQHLLGSLCVHPMPKTTVRRLVRQYMRKNPTLSFDSTRVWSLDLPNGAYVAFRGPRPSPDLTIPSDLDALPPDAEGFARYGMRAAPR